MSESIPAPSTRLVKRLPTPDGAILKNVIITIGQLYNKPGQVFDVNSQTPYGAHWSETPFLVNTDSGRIFYGRPSLRVRDKQQRIIAETGLIVDADAARTSVVEDITALRVALPGRALGRLVVGEVLPFAESAGHVARVMAFPQKYIKLESQMPPEQQPVFDDQLQRIEEDIKELGNGNSLWEIGTRCLWALGQD